MSTTVGGNLENKEIGLQIGLSGTHNNTEIDPTTGLLRLKQIDTDENGKVIFADEGSWISDTINLGDKFYDFERVFTNHVVSGSSSFAVLTRVSDDGNSWSEWLPTGYDGAIQSDTKQYIQIRIDFFVGFQTEGYFINKDEYTQHNQYVKSNLSEKGSYIIPKLTSNSPTDFGFPFASSVLSSSYPIWYMFDKSANTYYNGETGKLNGVYGYSFKSPKRITKYKMMIHSNYINNIPSDWTFEASENTTTGLDGDWVVLDTRKNEKFTANVDKEFSFDNPKSYIAYRVNYTKLANATNYVIVSEMDFFESTPGKLGLKRDYQFDMAIDDTWTDEGSLHRKKIIRDDWLRIDKVTFPTNTVIEIDKEKSKNAIINGDLNVSTVLDSIAKIKHPITEGKIYWEVTPYVLPNYGSTQTSYIGLATADANTIGNSPSKSISYYGDRGVLYSPIYSNSSYGSTYTANDTIGVAYDADNAKITFYKNGVAQKEVDTGFPKNAELYPAYSSYYASSAKFNFGVKEKFKYPIPSGYSALNSDDNKTLILHDGDYKKWYSGVQQVNEGYSSNAIPKMTSNTTPSGVASASSSYGAGWQPFNAFDRDSNANGWVASSKVFPSWIQYKFESSIIIGGYSIGCFEGYHIDTPKDWTFEGSNDGSSWVVLDTRSNIIYTKQEVKTFYFNNKDKYLYYRLNITNQNGGTYIRINEMEMFEYIPPVSHVESGWKTLYSTLPTTQQFISESIEDLSIFNRKVTKHEPLPMIDKSEILVDGEGKVFSKTLDLKKCMDIRSIKVEVK